MGTAKQPPTPAEARVHLLDLVRKFDTAMVTTHGDGESLRARPMAIARVDDDGTMYFSTQIESPKVGEIERDRDVLVTVQDKRRFASVSGRCRFSRDRALIHDLWSETWKAWFDGKDDPSIVILVVEPTTAEYWDVAGLRGISLAFDMLKGMLGGEKADRQAPGEANAKVDLR